MTVADRVCVVTGAASGIGLATAQALAGNGAVVTGVDLNAASADKLVAEWGGPAKAHFVRADLTAGPDRDVVVRETIDRFGRIDVLVNCAGVGSLKKVPEVTPEEWDRVFDINLKSVFFLTQLVMDIMVKQGAGTIICVSSAAAKIGGVAVGPHYSASKAGVICLTKSLALYGAQKGVTANCVCPGPTETPLTDTWGTKLNEEFAAKIPMKRYGTPAEIADVILFLASDSARYMTGETVDVNGGLVMD
jgi:NAD(P)-dependent dehydrogenase (short-subunit alcohol dehydrogenase family)